MECFRWQWNSGLAMAGAAVLCSCENSRNSELRTEWWRLEARRVSLESQVELVRFQLSHQTEFESERKEAEARLSVLDESLAERRSELRELREDLNRLDLAITTHRTTAMEQRRADWHGKTLPSIMTSEGRRFEDVTISEVSRVGVKIRHETGLARLTPGDLSSEQCEAFGIDPNESRELLAKEAERQEAYRRRAEARVAAAERESSATRPFTVRAVSANQPSSSDSARSNPLHEPPRRFGGVRTYRSSSHRTRFYHVWYTGNTNCRYPSRFRTPATTNFCREAMRPPAPRYHPVPCP